MPVAEKIGGGEVYLRGIDERVTVGDRVDVNEAFAAYLAEERGDFRIVEGDSSEAEPSDGDDEDGDGFDAGAFVDRTPVEDVVEDIRAGEADGHLDAVAGAADRVTVQDAIGERRAELEAEEA